MRKTKTVYRMYAAWEHEREVEDLEALSKQGWQLVKGGLIRSAFAFDDSVEYRYALDFRGNISDPARYRETFAEQGWECLNSTFNGWHYFRKVYDPSLPEEEYQIYTDDASKKEMAARWRRIAWVIGGAELVFGAAYLIFCFFLPAIYSLCLGLGAVLLGLLLIYSARWMNRGDRRRSPGKLLIPVFVLMAAALVLGAFRTEDFRIRTEYAVPETDDALQYSFEVKLPDVYTLDVSVDAPAEAAIALVKQPSGDAPAQDWEALPCCYYAEGTRIEQRARLFLTPGAYSLYTRYLPGAEPGLAGKFEYEFQ